MEPRFPLGARRTYDPDEKTGEVWASLGVRNNMIRRVLSLQLVRTVS